MVTIIVLWIGLFAGDGALVQPYPADSAFASLNYPVALNQYDSLLVVVPDDPGLLWRLARLYVCMGDTAAPERREGLYRQADGYASRTITLAPDLAAGHTWKAAALGNIAMFVGGETKVRLSWEIREELDMALRLDPDDDVAWSILGTFYRVLSNVSWVERTLAGILFGGLPEGGYEQAEHALRRAISLAPSVVRHRFELALVLLDTDREDEAADELRWVLELRPTLAKDSSSKAQARRLLNAIQGG